jgi:flagellar biosynthetic protein FliR
MLALGTFEAQLGEILFLSLRAGAAMLAAPLFGAISVPPQLRAFFGVALAVFISQWVPLPAVPDLNSIEGGLILLQEAVIGFALGFILQVAFFVPILAAEQIAGTMGLAMATAIDPASGAQSGAIGQFFSLLLIFIFLSLGAHLVWFELIIESYRLLPPGSGLLSAGLSKQIVDFGGAAFAAAAAIALPIVLILLLVQTVTGILSRSAPALNLFALGLPAGVLAGLAALIAGLPIITEQMSSLTSLSLEAAAAMIAAP